MFGVVGELNGRTPKSDAPPLDPSLWEGRDCAFITLLRDQYYEQQRLERNTQEEFLAGDTASPGYALFSTGSHTQPVSRPSTWWGKLLRYLFPRYYAQKNLASLGFAQLSSEELVTRMHFALQAGDTELSALIARELAKRRARLYENEENVATATVAAGGTNRVGDSWRFTSSLNHATHPGTAAMTSPRLNVVSPRVHSNQSTTTRTAAAADSSFTVPDVLLRQRRSVDTGASIRF